VQAEVAQHAAQLLWGWAMGQSLTLADAPRCTLHMLYNAVSPFMAFFEVRTLLVWAIQVCCLCALVLCPPTRGVGCSQACRHS
jgi:hypothetical protein